MAAERFPEVEFETINLLADDLPVIMLFVVQLSTFVFDEVLTVSNIYLNLESSQALL